MLSNAVDRDLLCLGYDLPTGCSLPCRLVEGKDLFSVIAAVRRQLHSLKDAAECKAFKQWVWNFTLHVGSKLAQVEPPPLPLVTTHNLLLPACGLFVIERRKRLHLLAFIQ